MLILCVVFPICLFIWMLAMIWMLTPFAPLKKICHDVLGWHKPSGVYLAGACRGMHDGGKEWRLKAENIFKNISEAKDVTIKVINPTRYFDRDGGNAITNKQVKQFYLSRIRKCDLILVNLEHTNTSIGTAQELQFAVDNHIPIIGFNDYDSYEWLPEDCDVIFKGINEAIDYINDFYLE